VIPHVVSARKAYPSQDLSDEYSLGKAMEKIEKML
jgi:hypothetical protein